jgi:dehydrodolichyl diphosphate syntase complex subunit NUS1
VTKLDTTNKLHIILFSPQDGKPDIVEAMKKLIRMKNNNSDWDAKDEITETKVNDTLNGSLEPDLLIVFGSISSTMGFLPWHIRLTEIQ